MTSKSVVKKVTKGMSGGVYWQDANGNRWRTSRYTRKEAEELSSTLTDCRECLECSHCSGCISCIDCNCCERCIECVGCGYCYMCEKCSTIGYSLACNRCLCCSHCTTCDYCVNIYHCSCVCNTVNGMLLANVKDGGELERAAALCSLATDLGAIVGKFGSSTVEHGARLWIKFGNDNVRLEYPSDNGEVLIDVHTPNYDPIHPKEVSENRRRHVMYWMPKEAEKFLRLWQQVIEEDDRHNKKGKKND